MENENIFLCKYDFENKRFSFGGNFCAIFEKGKENIAIVIKFGEVHNHVGGN